MLYKIRRLLITIIVKTGVLYEDPTCRSVFVLRKLKKTIENASPNLLNCEKKSTEKINFRLISIFKPKLNGTWSPAPKMRISVHIFFIFYFMVNNIDITMKELTKDTHFRPAYPLFLTIFDRRWSLGYTQRPPCICSSGNTRGQFVDARLPPAFEPI